MSLSNGQVRDILLAAQRIAVVGLSPNPARPSHGVAAYLQRSGYTIIPVRPAVTAVLGQPAHADLASAGATGPIDIVDVFRRAEFVPALVDPILSIRPKLVILQLGVIHQASAQRLEAAGIAVLMDRCLAVEYSRLIGH